MQNAYYQYVFNNRQSGFHHPTREKILALFYEMRRNAENISSFTDYYFSRLDGEPGLLSDEKEADMQYMILNCCFYFCGFLLDCGVDPELAYNSTDFFANKARTVTTEAKMKNLLEEIARASLELCREAESIGFGATVRRCIAYISQKLYSPLTLEEVSGHLKLTPQYLTTLFRKETGMTLYSYIRKKKATEARNLLVYTDKSLTLIANMLGFSSSAHFSTSFKKETGLAPSEFRRHPEIQAEK